MLRHEMLRGLAARLWQRDPRDAHDGSVTDASTPCRTALTSGSRITRRTILRQMQFSARNTPSQPVKANRRLYSAVVDSKPKYLRQAERLVWSLREHLHVAQENIILHAIGTDSDYPSDWIERIDVPLKFVDAHPSHPYCNKLQAFPSLASLPWDDVVLLDCDTFLLDSPPQNLTSIQAKIVDFANPPDSVLRALFSAAQLPYRCAVTHVGAEPTVFGNANGGVYIIPHHAFRRLWPSWLRWSDWCMKHLDLFQDWSIHIDQVSFAMALAETGLNFTELDQIWNFPTHIKDDRLGDCEPKILHYHSQVDETGILLEIATLERATESIRIVNSSLARLYSDEGHIAGD